MDCEIVVCMDDNELKTERLLLELRKTEALEKIVNMLEYKATNVEPIW